MHDPIDPARPDAALCGARRPGWEDGPAVGRHRLPCTLPAGHAPEDHRDALGQTWPAAPFADSKPDMPWGNAPIAPTYGPTVVTNHEGGHGMRAVVRTAVALTRGQLLAALACGFAETGPDRDPDTLTADQVRQEVEEYVAASSCLELDDAVRQLRAAAAGWTPERRSRMDALGRAVDRAYPPAPPVGVLLGTLRAPVVRCPVSGCGWIRCGGRTEALILAAGQHAAEVHGAVR